LKLPNENDDIGTIDEPLPSVKRLADLIILRHFDYKFLLINQVNLNLTQSRFTEWF
jgi:hypothetical protein